MKKILNKLKQFKYYRVSLIALLLITIAAGYFLKLSIAGSIALGIFSTLIILALIRFFIGIRNTWVIDGLKGEAIFFGVFGIAFVTALIYVIIKFLL